MMLRSVCLSFAVVAAGLVAPQPARADIMLFCAPVIAERCSDVRQGRGRMVACLAANNDQIAGDCKAAVDREMSKRIVRMSVPIGATPLGTSPEGAELSGACTAELAALCSGVRSEVEPMLACLYARGERVSRSCKSTADKVNDALM